MWNMMKRVMKPSLRLQQHITNKIPSLSGWPIMRVILYYEMDQLTDDPYLKSSGLWRNAVGHKVSVTNSYPKPRHEIRKFHGSSKGVKYSCISGKIKSDDRRRSPVAYDSETSGTSVDVHDSSLGYII